MNYNTANDWNLHSAFTVAACTSGLQGIEPYLVPQVHPGDVILDLCGSGLASFWFEAQGAKITAVDFAPYMIARA